jgi:hypothetical protein
VHSVAKGVATRIRLDDQIEPNDGAQARDEVDRRVLDRSAFQAADPRVRDPEGLRDILEAQTGADPSGPDVSDHPAQARSHLSAASIGRALAGRHAPMLHSTTSRELVCRLPNG